MKPHRLAIPIVALAMAAVTTLAGPDAEAAGLLVGSMNTDSVLGYDGTTGAFTGTFASGGGLDGPTGLFFGPDGKLYVGSGGTNQVLRYDGTTGSFFDVFVEVGSGGLSGPFGLAFAPVPVTAPIPEPGTLLLLGSGLAGVAAWGGRRRKTGA